MALGKYKYVLLDWDGNLARTLDIWHAALKEPLIKRGHNFADDEIGANFAIFQERMEQLGIKDIAAIIGEAHEIAARECPNVELYPEAITTLEKLRELGAKIALVTTSQHYQIDPLLQKYDMASFFDAVVCGDDVSSHKPHPEPIEKALKLLGAEKQEAVMVGDSGNDISGATNAGIDSILFFPEEHVKFYKLEKLQEFKPTYVVERFYEIVSIASS